MIACNLFANLVTLLGYISPKADESIFLDRVWTLYASCRDNDDIREALQTRLLNFLERINSDQNSLEKVSITSTLQGALCMILGLSW